MSKEYIYWIPTEMCSRRYFNGRSLIGRSSLINNVANFDHHYLNTNTGTFDRQYWANMNSHLNSYRLSVSILKRITKVAKLNKNDPRIGVLDRDGYVYFI